jgi:hypothetical protein
MTANDDSSRLYSPREREPAALRELKRSLRRCGIKKCPNCAAAPFDHGQCDDIGT